MRQYFTTDRALEYFTESELTKQMGTSRNKWGITLVKELVDNAFDAAETIGVNPSITITAEDDSISIQDNGGGIPENVIRDSLNFNVRVSDKNGYVSPSRGQQGNALMCVYAVPYVLNGDHAHVEIHSSGTRYDIDVSLDQIVQAPVVKIDKSQSDFVENGTFIKIHDLDSACLQDDLFSTIWLFSCCNPHADLTLIHNGEEHHYPRTGDQVKWTPAMPLVSHWYNTQQFINLIASTLHKNPDTTVNEFLSQFDGLKAPPKQKQVCDAAGVKSRDGLAQFADNGRINKHLVEKLLETMTSTAREVNPVKLGFLDPEHITQLWGGEVQHRSAKGMAEGLPFTMSVFFQISYEWEYNGLDVCLNNSVLIDGRISTIGYTIHDTRIEKGDPVKLLVHIAYPQFEFLGKGKNQVNLPWEIREKLESMIEKVASDFTKEKKRQERDRAKKYREEQKPRPKMQMSQVDAAFQVMESAYMRASANDTLPAKCRQVFYAARPEILSLCEIKKLSDDYFRTLVRRFERENPELTKDWDIIYDARGSLIEPYTGERVPLGTVGVRQYINTWEKIRVMSGGDFKGPSITEPVVSHFGHFGLYKYALLIEKEGFEPLIEAARIQERYGIALLSTKGMSTFAARDLVERLSEEGVTTFVLHDFDQAGFIIARTLGDDTDVYKFKSDVKVIDIGFRLEDIQGLEREPVAYQTKTDPRESMLDAGITQDEVDILVQGGRPGRWHGERVELNAMPSGQLVELIESKLEQHGVKKVVPDAETLEDVYKKIKSARAKDKALNKIMGEYLSDILDALSKYEESEIEVPEDLPGIIAEKISGNRDSWETALHEIARQN
jgi:DNA topoisomerase VI subunit B